MDSFDVLLRDIKNIISHGSQLGFKALFIKLLLKGMRISLL